MSARVRFERAYQYQFQSSFLRIDWEKEIEKEKGKEKKGTGIPIFFNGRTITSVESTGFTILFLNSYFMLYLFSAMM